MAVKNEIVLFTKIMSIFLWIKYTYICKFIEDIGQYRQAKKGGGKNWLRFP